MAPDGSARSGKSAAARQKPTLVNSVCPHDCTSTCALEIEVRDAKHIGRVRGSTRNTYTNGVICEKVARYAERVHHPDRLQHPLKRSGPKGSGQFTRISWDEALDTVAEQFQRATAKHGSEAVSVSYTHLDVYKRQRLYQLRSNSTISPAAGRWET